MGKSGYTGGLFEADLLYDSEEAKKLVKKTPKEVPHKSMRQAIQVCLTKNQDNPNGFDDPERNSDPASIWLNDVHANTADQLGLEDWDNLKVFPTLNSSADIHHGIDTFFVYTDPKTGKQAIVTIDFSMRPNKTFKTDVKVSDTAAEANYNYNTEDYDLPDLEGASKKELDQLEQKRRKELGRMIAEIIQQKLEEGDRQYGPNVYKALESLKTDIREKVESALA